MCYYSISITLKGLKGVVVATLLHCAISIPKIMIGDVILNMHHVKRVHYTPRPIKGGVYFL